MKIFSNFDTELPKRLYKEAVAEFGEKQAIFVSRDSIYLYVRFILPILLWAFLVFIFLYTLYGVIGKGSGLFSYARFFFRGLSIAATVYLWIFIGAKLINYYLDFVIITPKQITMYDQGGIFARNTRSIDTEKIKTINVLSQGRLSSIFNYGSIVFLAEGDVENGEIMLRFISKPIRLRDNIYRVIELHDKFADDE